ncbi:MAG TPA: hypothetical protein ACFYEJ_08065 [Candidatus Wujingus californicus]
MHRTRGLVMSGVLWATSNNKYKLLDLLPIFSWGTGRNQKQKG